MMNNAMNRIKEYATGVGTRPMLQNVVDYGGAAAIGAVGQQGMNMLTPGSDPNAFLSGAMMAPALAFGGRGLRGSMNPASTGMDAQRMVRQTVDPFQQAALLGSASSLGAGALTSGYNTVAGGADIDNNIPASILASAVPLTAYLLSQRAKSIPVM